MNSKLPVFTFFKSLCLITLIISYLTPLNAQPIEMGLSTRRTLPTDFYGYDMSTTVRGGVSCLNQNLLNNLPLLKPKTLRYPAGSHANWWNWRVGWYVNSPYLPEKNVNAKKIPNKLEDFKGLLTATGAKAILDLNLLTSNVTDQIAMMKHADSIGIEVKYIELGNEFYLEGDGADDTVLLLIRYPTPESYADTAQIWIDSIRKHFPDVKIGLQGVFDKNHQERRNLWNDAVILPVEGEDAITMHYYFSSHWPDSLETEADKLDVNMGDVPNWFYQPYKAWEILRDKSLSKVPADEDVWITEYNFSDHERPTHGTWASGLYTALHSMQLLQDDRIKLINLHGVDGQAVFGAYFYGTNGFQFGLGEEASYIPPPNPPLTQAWGLNSFGHTMTMMGNAIDAQTFASRIEFSPNPQITTVEIGVSYLYNGLFGYLFNNANSSQAIIVNVTGSNQTVKTNLIFPGGGTYELRYAPVLSLITGNSSVNITTGTLPQNYVMPPYSIVRMQGNSIPQAPPVASITAGGPLTFCADDSVELDAGPNYYAYLWSTGATTRKITVRTTGDYWVHAYTVPGGYYGSDEISVIVNPLPVKPNVMPDGNKTFCQGGSVVLHPGPNTVYENATYYWPLSGQTTWSSTATTQGNHYLIVTDSNGCSITSDPEYITVNPLPQPVVVPIGPTAACYDVDVTLQANAGYNNYTWSGGGSGQTRTFGVSGSYSVTVTDVNNCKATSAPITITVWEPPLPTITSSGPSTFCKEAGVYLSTLPNYQYQWYKFTAVLTGETNQNFSPVLSANYKVEITDTNGCSKQSATFAVTVNSLTAPNITTSPNSTTICAGGSAILSVPSTYASYLWSNTQSSSSINVNSAGSYSVTVTDTKGCKATSLPKVIAVNPLPQPVISASGPTSFCDGGSVVLSTGNYTKYNWSNSKTTATTTIFTSGSYTVTVTDANGCINTSAPFPVTVWTQPKPIISTSSGSTTFCDNAGVYLTTSANSSGYQWQKSGVNIAGATSSNYTPLTGGSYKVITTDINGCSKTSASLSITVKTHPSPTITGPSSICQGSSATLSTGSYSSYLWSTGHTTSSIPVTSAGSFNVMVTDSNGCTGTSANKTMTVNALPTPSITAQGATSFCDGGSVVLDAGSGYTKYSWSNGKATQTITVTASGSFTVNVTNAGGCSATSAPLTVTEWVLPNPAINAVGPTAFCIGAGSYLTTISGYSYQWMKGTVNETGATSQNFIPTSTGTYKVKITDSHGCTKTATAGVQMTVYAAPTASVTVTGNTNLCSGQTATLKSNTGSGFTYFWKKNGSAIAGASTSTYIVSVAGDYTCTVTNTNGCTKISNTVTITNNCKDEEGAFSNENTPVKWLIYPNPASEKLHVKLWLPGTENGNCELELRNILGEVIYTEKLIYEMNYLSVDLHLDRSLAAGLYFVIVKQGAGLYRTPFMISRH